MQPLVDGEEYFADIPGYEDYYQVSNLGNVRSVDRRVVGRNGLLKGKPKAIRISNNGYAQVFLYKNCKLKGWLVHRLVAIVFVNNPNNKPEVNHIDGDRLNNHHSNLEWCTRSENALHGTRILNKNRGENNSRLLKNVQVLEIKQLLVENNLNQHQIGALFGVSNHTIHKIKYGHNWGWLDEKENRTLCNL